MSELHQIYYAEEQKASLFPFAIPVHNEKLTHFFENSVIVNVVLASQAKNVAVCSWKLKEKLRWYIGVPREITQELLDGDYHVLSFTKNTKYHQTLASAERWHPGFNELLNKILAHVGIHPPREVKNPIYQNHFSAKREIYQHYVNNYLRPCMWVMDNQPEINMNCWRDSGYTALNKFLPHERAAMEKRMIEQIGVPYWPMFPFLLERLFSIYCHNNRIPITWL